MTLHRTTLLTTCLTLTVLGTACDLGDKPIGNDTGADEGETGDPTGDGDTGDDTDGTEAGYGGDCGEEVESIINDLEATLPGFDSAAADYIALIEGTFVGNFNWLPPDGPVTVEHAGTTSPLTMTVAYNGGEIRLLEVELLGQPPQGEGLEACGNILQIDVALGFETEDGLFSESFEVPLTINSAGNPIDPSFYFSLDMETFQGQLALDDFTVDMGEVSDLVLIGGVDGEVATGSLNIEILTMDWVGFGSIAGFEATRQP